MSHNIKLIDNTTLKGREDKFTTLKLDLEKVVKSWKDSLFSFEWLTPEGDVRTPDQLSPDHAAHYKKIEDAYKKDEALERPILGLGMLDNIEIGSRKEVLLTLYHLGIIQMDVYVPKSCLKDFQKFI